MVSKFKLIRFKIFRTVKSTEGFQWLLVQVIDSIWLNYFLSYLQNIPFPHFVALEQDNNTLR